MATVEHEQRETPRDGPTPSTAATANLAGKWSGREFSESELETIRQIIAADKGASRAQIAQRVCEAIDWRRPNGDLKTMRARVVLLRMHESGHIHLPPPRNGNGNQTRHQQQELPPKPEPAAAIDKRVDQLGELNIEILTSAQGRRNALWRSYLSHYHYLGWTPVVGSQMRYWVSTEGQLLALISFGAAAWKVSSRDSWIGWEAKEREQRLPWIINNTRYLILPWVTSKNLASAILGALTKRVAEDWEKAYGIRPVLVETFVDSARFAGTCYKAANWIHVGQTQGRGKYDQHHQRQAPVKDVWIYPLRRNPTRFLNSARHR